MKKVAFQFLLILSLLIFLIPDFRANAQENEGLEKISSVNNYVEYLSEKSKDDESAKKVLSQFLELSEENQELFIQALQPENYLKIINAAQERPNENIGVKLNNGKKIDIQFNLNTQQDVNNIEPLYANNMSDIGTAATTYRVTTPWASADFGFLGIITSKFSIQMILQTDGTNALDVYDIEKKYVNNNPAVWTTDIGHSSFYVSGGLGFGGYQWKLSSTGALGGLSSNLDMIIRANHSTTREFKINSGRSDWATNWASF